MFCNYKIIYVQIPQKLKEITSIIKFLIVFFTKRHYMKKYKRLKYQKRLMKDDYNDSWYPEELVLGFLMNIKILRCLITSH